MRLSFFVLFAASLVSALSMLERDIEAPDCAVECQAESNPEPCNSDEAPCLCLNFQYISDISACVASLCSPEDAEAAAAAAAEICKDAGVDNKNPFPSCGVECAEKSLPAGCDYDDGACFCNDDEYIQSFAKCIQNSCTEEDLESAPSVGEALCRAYGGDICTQGECLDRANEWG